MTASYAFEDVLISLGVLAVVVGSEFVVSLFIPKDPSTLQKFMVVGTICAIVMNCLFFMLLFSFGLFPTWFYVMYAWIGVVCSAIFILIDLLWIQSDAAKYDDYILGAVMLYLDIVRMFIYILQLVGN